MNYELLFLRYNNMSNDIMEVQFEKE